MLQSGYIARFAWWVRVSRALQDKEKKDAVRRLTGGWERILGDTADLLTDRRGFVGDEVERSPLATVVRSLSRYDCRLWARSDKSGYSVRNNAYREYVCGGYLDSLNENPDVGSLEYIRLGTFTATATNGLSQSGPLTLQDVGENYSVSFSSDLKTAFINWCVDDVFSTSTSFPPITITDIQWVVNDPVEFCGQGGPPLYTPPPPLGGSPPVLPPEITVNVPGLGSIGITVSLDDEGRPVVCIPALDVCATVDISLDGGAEPLTSIPFRPGDVGEPSAPVVSGDGGDIEGQAPEGSVIGALKVDILGSPSNAKQFAPGVFRGACYAYLGTEDGLDHDPAGAMLRDGQVIFPELPNLTHWAVKANPGYNLEVTPYYIEVTE